MMRGFHPHQPATLHVREWRQRVHQVGNSPRWNVTETGLAALLSSPAAPIQGSVLHHSVQVEPLDKRIIRFAANIIRLIHKFAGYFCGIVTRPRRTRLYQSPVLCEKRRATSLVMALEALYTPCRRRRLPCATASTR